MNGLLMDDGTPITPDPNGHVREYLDYYVNRGEVSGYAVLLSGRWGVGKTYQVEKIVGDLLKPLGKRHVRVSLYGLKSRQEIDDAMVTALYPWTNNDGVRIASAVGKALLKHAKIELPTIKSSDLVNKMSADVFIFDDLERSRMPVTDALGYINQLVERDGCKVIIVANEAEISDHAYAVGKEKLIGKTLDIELDFDAAFQHFLGTIGDSATKEFLQSQAAEIRTIHEQSGFKNLRLLQQTMWDFERLFMVIEQTHRANGDAMIHLLRLFFILSFEYKAGRLSAEDIEKRTEMSLADAMQKDSPPSPCTKAGAKYPGFHIYDVMLPDSLTTDLLVRGVVNPKAVADALDASSWFVSDNEPSWRTVWRSTERRDEDVRAAATTMQKEFKDRKYDLTGEILHLFGQMLFLADLRVSGRDRAQTLADCKAYIDDLRVQNRLEPTHAAYLDDIRYGSYGGLGFSQKETPEFSEIWQYVASQRAEAEVDGFAADAEKMIELMKVNTTEFVRKIAHGGNGDGRFANKPVFASCDPSIFADALISLEPESLLEAFLGMISRYDMAKLADGRELSGERKWVERLNETMMERANGMEPFARDRITKLTEWSLGKVLGKLQE